MKVEFNEDGSLKIPEKIVQAKEKLKRRIKEAEENFHKVIIDYEEVQPGYEDDWTITLPPSVPARILYRLKKWADQQHDISVGRAWINQKEEKKFILNIKGRQNRCTWAHTFLNGLNTALIKGYKTEVQLNNTCKHDFRLKMRV